MALMSINIDPTEIAKFSEIAHRWWDPTSEFRPLHEINPLRLDYIDHAVGLADKDVLDVGCGGGILAEAMAERGARVSGIDAAERPLKIAQLHLLESGRNVDYRLVTVEDLAAERPASYDVVTCMELLEHVPDPQSTVSVDHDAGLDQIECVAQTDDPGQALCASIDERHAPAAGGVAETGTGTSDAKIAPAGQLQATGQAVAVDRRNGRLLQVRNA
jgi:ubiquinone/menaquinone biosynthesis C-methylase UbiE